MRQGSSDSKATWCVCGLLFVEWGLRQDRAVDAMRAVRGLLEAVGFGRRPVFRSMQHIRDSVEQGFPGTLEASDVGTTLTRGMVAARPGWSTLGSPCERALPAGFFVQWHRRGQGRAQCQVGFRRSQPAQCNTWAHAHLEDNDRTSPINVQIPAGGIYKPTWWRKATCAVSSLTRGQPSMRSSTGLD